MRVLTVLIILFIAAACATSRPNERQPTDERIRLSGIEGNVFDVTIQRQDFAQDTKLDASPDVVWALLPDIYEAIGLPTPGADRSIWTIVVQDHLMSRRVGSERMSNLIDCGSGITGYYADTYRIRLSVRTWLEPDGTGTRVNTRVDATGTSTEGTAGSTTCVSRGGLETRIAELLRQHTST